MADNSYQVSATVDGMDVSTNVKGSYWNELVLAIQEAFNGVGRITYDYISATQRLAIEAMETEG